MDLSAACGWGAASKLGGTTVTDLGKPVGPGGLDKKKMPAKPGAEKRSKPEPPASAVNNLHSGLPVHGQAQMSALCPLF